MVPGAQCQVDGGELRGVQVDGVEITLYFVVFVLSYSRMMYVGLSRTPVNRDGPHRLDKNWTKMSAFPDH